MPRGRPRKRDQVQADAPVDPGSDTVVITPDKPIEDGWYWFGMVPRSGAVTLTVPNAASPKVGMHRKEIECDPWDLWRGVVEELGEFSLFSPELKQHNSVGVRGFMFTSFSEFSTQRDGQNNRVPFAGCAKRMRGDEATRIIDSCFKSYIRFADGIENRHISTAQQLEFFDVHEDVKPENMPEDEWRREPRYGDYKTVSPHTDMQIAEFVYLARFDGTEDSGYPLQALDWVPDGFDAKEYRFNSNRFHQTICPAITQGFFRNPPRSVAQMYPGFSKET